MNININDIFDFYELRIKCHIASMNYFASLLGYHFPEHDGDKVHEPIRTGYAYMFYKTYHKNFRITHEEEALSEDAKHAHHKYAEHHVQHYNQVKEIPDIRLYEMLADWASANFEQMNIIHEPDAISIQRWFDKEMSKLGWTEHQLEIIKKSFDIIKEKTDIKTITKIWQPLLEKADL